MPITVSEHSESIDGELLPTFLRDIPISFARRHRLVACLEGQGSARLVISPESDPIAIDAVCRRFPEIARIAAADGEAILRKLDRGFAERDGQTDEAIGRIEPDTSASDLMRCIESDDDLLDHHGRAPIVQLVNALIFEAVRSRASDLHIQPDEHEAVVRTRIDGVLFDAQRLPRSIHEELTSRVKVMGRMDIAEKRLPQDGRTTVRVGKQAIDLRVSTVPTGFGERVVIRLLDRGARAYALDELGMPPRVLAEFSEMIRIEHGLILVTGPTGSGKSTTLYGVLRRLDTQTLNALTLEDPIEFQLPGVSQMQVAARKGMTFAKGLRSILRQDPDIIMVGEIRDRETAELAIQAALTGHLVLSTLHTNDAASAVTRLLDLGIEPYLVASSLRAVMAQRLVRRVCPDCASPLDAGEKLVLQERLGGMGHAKPVSELSGARRGRGCSACRDTGYRGRVGVFEYLPVGEAVGRLVQNRRPVEEIRGIASQRGNATLLADGIEKILTGQTTAEEIARVTRLVDPDGFAPNRMESD